ncbi:hypothetical protein [Pelagicoccus sp. SDUM812003]|uniref:hypothetical protein n=1 Tax=Pelagicoccus sp. SDUM812003 TaxID=3041267 RepID=UPI00280D3D09|nr:hypothetical protein [Pelagicoccus sp. SDUM812003]MDQ8202739.1 hypothetical protein [Pelagicoccus sp. SDUM812003]
MATLPEAALVRKATRFLKIVLLVVLLILPLALVEDWSNVRGFDRSAGAVQR